MVVRAVMLGVVLAIASASAVACGASSKLAWPRSAAREADGGESLAPRAAARAIAAVESERPAERAAEKPSTEKPSTEKPAADAPAPAASEPAAVEDPVITEEMVIEIED